MQDRVDCLIKQKCEHFKRTQISRHNIQNVKNSLLQCLTCKGLGKCGQFLREKTINKCQPQDDTDVGIIRFRGAILTMCQEVKVNTVEMNGKTEVLSRDTKLINKEQIKILEQKNND